MNNSTTLKNAVCLTVLLVVTGFSTCVNAQDIKPALDVTYIANEGFLVQAVGKKVLIDALFDPMLKDYLAPSPEIIQAMTEAREPFTDIDLILVTHAHEDHFDPNRVIACLQNNPGAKLVAHTQVVDIMRSIDGFAQIENQIHEIKTAPGYHEEITPNDIPVNVLSLVHEHQPETNNLAFLVELGGTRFLNMGDAFFYESETYLKDYSFDETPVDILFLNHYDRSETTRQFIACKIKPSRIIAMHIPPADLREYPIEIYTAYPYAIVFNNSMEQRSISFEVDFHNLSGQYFGQTPPGSTPQVFARGIVSTDDLEHSGPSYSPDGNEVTWIVARHYGSNDDEWLDWYMTMRRENGRWSAPYVPPQDFDVTALSTDGLRAYTARGEDAWVIERQGDTWGEPQCLNILSRFPELQFLFWPSVAHNDTLYVHAYAPGVRYNYGIYRTEFVNGEYTQPELLPRCINLPPFQNWTLFIAPDESYLIFSSDRTGQLGEGDLYISFHDVSADTWTEPINMGEPINTRRQERLPMVSRDGKYLFFTRWTPDHDQDVFWVSAKVIDDIKRTALPDPNGLIKNTSTGQLFSSIQCAIDYAKLNETIVMEPGIYQENLTIDEKDIVIRSADPNDPYYIGGTIIPGDSDKPVVTLSNNSEACTLAGLTIRAGSTGIVGSATDATIRNCRIIDNTTHGIELSRESNPHLLNCLITANGETGINMKADPGRLPKICKPMIEDCVIVHNGQSSLVGGEPILVDSIVE